MQQPDKSKNKKLWQALRIDEHHSIRARVNLELFYFRTLTTQCKLLQKKSKNSLLWRKTEIRKEEALPPLPEGRGLRA
ncbi:MAG TPA: hypothetical protein DCM19_05435 [Parasutterella excrementihominis]|nr:hypothetical protein [Parasutterella excrementihominis]HBZ27901.1 hypothetical protein [Parasutterella excrementihominis]